MPAEPAVADRLAPLIFEVDVRCPPERAFDYFTRDIAAWWPLATHSIGHLQAASVAFEPRAGGRLYETLRDGSECAWGEVTHWEPARRVAFSWHPGRNAEHAQWVEVCFGATHAGTRVTLTHGGWERRDDGATARENYATGWTLVLADRYGDYCAAAQREGDSAGHALAGQ